MNHTPTKEQLLQWEHATNKSNWRITQLPNGYFQTEVTAYEGLYPAWSSITRRATLEEAEEAIDGSIEYFKRKLDRNKVVKTYN